MNEYKSFRPKQGGTFLIANGVAASADTKEIDPRCDEIAVYNSSATAIAFFRVTPFPTSALGSGAAPTVTADMPVAPGEHLRVHVGLGYKKIRTIASAADGNLYITPGT